MTHTKADLLQGTLDMLVLKALSLGPLHGYGIIQRIRQLSEEMLTVEQGSLYPALYRIEQRPGLRQWGPARPAQAKFYTRPGTGQTAPLGRVGTLALASQDRANLRVQSDGKTRRYHRATARLLRRVVSNVKGRCFHVDRYGVTSSAGCCPRRHVSLAQELAIKGRIKDLRMKFEEAVC